MTNLHKQIKQRTTLITRHNEAWDLVNKYQMKYEQSKNKRDLHFAQTYLSAALQLQGAVA